MAVKRWNGTTWDIYAGADTSPGFAATDGRSGRRTYVGANTPTAPVDGDIWIDQDTATNAIPASAFDAKGDLMVGTGPDTYTRQAVGTDGQVLVADSSQADGVLWSHTPSRQGLVNVVPTSVTVGSGSATVSANGAITIGSAVSSVTVNGAFSATYENYKIIISGSSSSAQVNLIYQNGALNTTTSYYGGLYGVNYTNGAFISGNVNNATGFTFAGGCDIGSVSFCAEVQNPFLAKYTTFSSSPVIYGNNRASFSGDHEQGVSYTSFTVLPASGTITGGTIRIYGYGNGA
jgi:hypothetical protein